MLFRSRAHETYGDDFFAETKMSFGEHIEDLRSHLMRALKWFALGMVLGFLFAKPMLWLILKEMYSDLARMEMAVKASGLDYTIKRPPQFTDGPHTGRYQTSVNQHLARGRSISRADIADYIVTHLDDRSTYRAWTEMAY